MTRNLPVLGRWFDFEPLVWLSLSHFGVEGHPDHFWAGWAESTPFRHRRPPRPLLGQSGCAAWAPVEPYLSHSGVEGSPKTLLGQWGCVYLIPASTATKITSGPVALYLSHSGVEESPKTLLGRSACVYLIPASKATNNISGPIGLCLSHSGV
jgi:hypothetical protein